MKKKGQFLNRIDTLLEIDVSRGNNTGIPAGEIYSGALNIAVLLYGKNSTQVATIEETYKRTMTHEKGWEYNRHASLANEIKGILKNIRVEIENDLIRSIQSEAKSDVLSDFVALSKELIEEGRIDVASVLSCAALEDTLKKYAELNGLEVSNKDMSEVISALRGTSLISGTEIKLLQSYNQLRNRSFHAQWDKIDSISVKSLLSFIEEFLIKKF
jgi:hypothetical protein